MRESRLAGDKEEEESSEEEEEEEEEVKGASDEKAKGALKCLLMLYLFAKLYCICISHFNGCIICELC